MKTSNNVLARHLKPPFTADKLGGIVWTSTGLHLADVRGWGALKNEKDAEAVQDFHLQFMVDALNEKVARDAALAGKGAPDIDWETHCARLRAGLREVLTVPALRDNARTLNDQLEVLVDSVPPTYADRPAGELLLRKLLWLRHGCTAFYGDDGEMTCGACAIDFKRAPVADIEKRFEEIGRAKLATLCLAVSKGQRGVSDGLICTKPKGHSDGVHQNVPGLACWSGE